MGLDILTLAMAKTYSDQKGGYAETNTILKMVCSATDDMPMLFDIGDFTPEVGKTYVVTVDGVTATNTAVSIDADGVEYVTVGNLAIAGIGDDSGENYVIVYTPEIAGLMHKTKQYPETVALTINTETIVPIDQKFLPGVCLPVVELTTTPTAEGAALTAEETAQLANAFARSKYALFYALSVSPFPALCSVLVEDGLSMFVGYIVSETKEIKMIQTTIIDGTGRVAVG